MSCGTLGFLLSDLVGLVFARALYIKCSLALHVNLYFHRLPMTPEQIQGRRIEKLLLRVVLVQYRYSVTAPMSFIHRG